MSPELKHQVDRLRLAIGRLDALFEKKQSVIAVQDEEREDYVKERWLLQRDLAAVKHARDDYDKVTEENLRLKEREARLAEEMRDLRGKVKALSEYLHQ